MNARHARGFSLIEVLVALVVCSIGLLGLAKMESLAIASTDVAGTRAVAAIQAASLAAMMHANRAYWGGGYALASTTVQVTNGAVVISNSSLNGSRTACTATGSSACNYAQMAAYDLQNWGTTLQGQLPGYLATIACSTTGFPVTCTIQLTWRENGVAVTPQQTQMANLALPTYTMYVEP